MRSAWRADLSAGLCVAGLLLPEAVAYAGLARLPASHGLMACLAGLALYALAGRSRDAIVSPTSSSASMAAAAALGMAGVPFADAMLALTLATGGLLLLMAATRQGQLSAYVSRPVLRGVAFAVALTVVIRQLPDLLGLGPAPPVDALGTLHWVLHQMPHWHGPSMAVAALAGALVLLLRRWPQWPGLLMVMLAAIALAHWVDLPTWGVQRIGEVPAPRMTLSLPELSRDAWLRAMELSVGVTVLVFAESWGSVRSLALRRGERLSADRELFALGLANVGSALAQGMPVGAGFSASIVNHSAGARSRLAGGVAFGGVLLFTLVALPALAWLPRPVLAVAVITALSHALSPGPLLATWRLRRDRAAVIGAVAAVLLLGLLHGMLVAVALSIVMALRSFSRPQVLELAQLPGTRDFVARVEHAEVEAVDNALILRVQAPLFFASAERAVSALAERLDLSGAQTLVLSLEESPDLDSTALECLMELDARLAASGRHLLLARVKERVRELLLHADPQGLGRGERLFWSVADAADSLR